jgi:transposase-like protein
MNEFAPCYSDEIAQRILGELSGGRSLRAVCRDQGMPSYSTVRMWILEDRHGFRARYRQARTIEKAGCPRHYTAAIAERILEQLRAGRSLTDICHDPGMPSSSTARRWVIEDSWGFAARYRQARETGRAKPGPRSTFTAEMAEWILDELADGRTLAEVCRDYGMPARGTVRHWVKQDPEDFAARFREARESGYEVMADDITAIADDDSRDRATRRRKDGSTETVVDQQNINRSRLRISSRRWILSKALPRTYGDRPDPTEQQSSKDIAEFMRLIDGRSRGLPSEDVPLDPESE